VDVLALRAICSHSPARLGSVKSPEAGVWVLSIGLSEGGSLALAEALVRPRCLAGVQRSPPQGV